MPDSFNAAIGRYFARERKRQGRTQAEVAKMIGMCESSVSYIESARVRPSLQTFARLCALLKLDPTTVLEEAVGLEKTKRR